MTKNITFPINAPKQKKNNNKKNQQLSIAHIQFCPILNLFVWNIFSYGFINATLLLTMGVN